MNIRHSTGVGIVTAILLVVGIGLLVVLWCYPQILSVAPGSDWQWFWTLGITATTAAVILSLLGFHFLSRRLGHGAYKQQGADDVPKPAAPSDPGASSPSVSQAQVALKTHLQNHYGIFWRLRVRILLVVGEVKAIEALAPGLSEKGWLEGENTLLLWGGSPQASLLQVFSTWGGLSRWRALDGVAWALDKEQSVDEAAMATGVGHLQALARSLHWQLPLHLWEVCSGEWAQGQNLRQTIGCLLPSRFSGDELDALLADAERPLCRQGLAQVFEHGAHDFLLRLSADLRTEGIARWRRVLVPLLPQFGRGVALQGLWFGLPARRVESASHHWRMGGDWAGIRRGRSAGHRLGWPPGRIGHALVLGLALVWGGGLVLSFVSNRAQIVHVQTSLSAVSPSGNADQQLLALNELLRELGRLDERAQRGEPWYLRFGLSQNAALLAALWPRYVDANNRLVRIPAAASLEQQLGALVALPADSPLRIKRAHNAYLQLKAYLMMGRAEKTDAAFLTRVLGKAELARAGVTPGLWQGLSPTLWQFYAEQLPAHPEWQIELDQALVAQVRQVLITLLGQRNAEASLYQKVLDDAASHVVPLSLAQMVGETDAWTLFSTDASVAGVFTRQAWDGHVRQAIDDIAEARREEIDWVLSDREGDISVDLTPERLRARLTERYFQDYASAWIRFLNSVRWQRADSLGEVIDQLTLMSDVRQSPLIALMNTLAWQGRASSHTQALGDSLVASAKKLIGGADTHDGPTIEEKTQAIAGPLDSTFGPLLALLGKDSEAKGGDDHLSLQAFLTRVTRLRLKLQHVSHASDPQGMTQAMAQTVFQGKGIDLTDSQSYGGLIAASLGAEWSALGHALFVQPLDQAWQHVLQPSVASFNRQWREAVVDHWNDAFSGRYPFAATGSDASLPMLGKMIRADSGRIEQFLQRQLAGVLRKDGGRWVVDPRHSQGLVINPAFLHAVNQLSHLADVLYTDGGMGLGFELQGKAARDVVQTTFILNGARHHYFNQKESWQRFTWPGSTDYPGASLSWTSVHGGDRLYGDFQGGWGLIRLLEKATIMPLDASDSLFRMIVTAPDGLDLTWHMRTELGAGPMSVLQLRGFTLPSTIFLSGTDRARSALRVEAVE